MMSDPRYTPTEHWYVPNSMDRSAVGQKKIDELQRQILSMEKDRKDRSALIHKLNRLQTVQDEKREVEEKVLERNSRNSTPRLLQSEMERLYGRESQLERNNSPGLDKNVIETVIQHRTKEFSQKQQEAALKAKYLDKERQRLVDARRRVEEQRRALLNTMSPTGKPQISFHNDKLYLPYQPYHFFDNREERIRNSFVLPISKEFPKTENWKFKIKFVPMPIEEGEVWNKYEKQITEEQEPEVDEAVKAFQSFTQNKRRSQQPAHKIVRYVPQYTAEDINCRPAKRRSKTHDNYWDYYWRNKVKNLGLTQSAYDFRESLKFATVHKGYRKPKERGKQEFNRRHETVDTMHKCSDQYYLDQQRKNNMELDYSRKLKVKFHPKAAYGDTYLSKRRGPYWVE